MGAFNINITGVGGHGCERTAKKGQKLHGRCGRFTCPDCLAYEFTQRLRQAGMLREGDTAQGQEVKHSPACNQASDDGCTCNAVPAGAEVYEADTEMIENGVAVKRRRQFWKKPHQAFFTHWPGEPGQVVDDMLKNERASGSF